jgi:hypothetical protein
MVSPIIPVMTSVVPYPGGISSPIFRPVMIVVGMTVVTAMMFLRKDLVSKRRRYRKREDAC